MKTNYNQNNLIKQLTHNCELAHGPQAALKSRPSNYFKEQRTHLSLSSSLSPLLSNIPPRNSITKLKLSHTVKHYTQKIPSYTHFKLKYIPKTVSKAKKISNICQKLKIVSRAKKTSHLSNHDLALVILFLHQPTEPSSSPQSFATKETH